MCGYSHAVDVRVFVLPMPGTGLSMHDIFAVIVEHNGQRSKHDQSRQSQSETPPRNSIKHKILPSVENHPYLTRVSDG